MHYEEVDATQYASDIATTMESKSSNFKVEFKHEIDSSLGQFTIDIASMRSALINFLENSFDACRKDLNKTEHLVTLKVHNDTDKDSIVFEVSDNGIGMDRETQEKIFSLFFSSKGIEGTGLGLFISNKIIKKHGGTIDVSSKSGEGAHFKIRIPRNPPASLSDQADEPIEE